MNEELIAQVFKKTRKEGNTFAGGIPYLKKNEGWPVNSMGHPLLFCFK